jgi:bifunctional UDP-N-acetylglucosamine pyrophosphorylase/glucosamine-1-phosphate N-acetyltransferase
VIVEDVPADALAVGRGQQATKNGWASIFRAGKAALKKAGKKPTGAV